jgi:hypothetical protein
MKITQLFFLALLCISLQFPAQAQFAKESGKLEILADESDNKHKHFGQIQKDLDGNYHIFYRKGDAHALADETVIYHRKYDAIMQPIGGETAIAGPVTGKDYRSISVGMTAAGRIVGLYTESEVPAATPTLFKVFYFDDGDISTIQHVGTVLSVPNTYALTYGRIMLTGGTLVATPYYELPSGDMRIPQLESTDDGETWAESAYPVFEGVGYNEAEIIETDAGFFAVARGAGARIFHSTDRQTFSYLGLVNGTTNSEINGASPTLDKFKHRGVDWLVLGYVDRVSDKMVYRYAPAASVLADLAAFDALPQHEFGYDYENASGYQSIAREPDGSVLADGQSQVLVFKEFQANTYTQIRTLPFEPSYIRYRRDDVYIAGSTTAGSNTYAHKRIWIERIGNRQRGTIRVALSGAIDVATAGAIDIHSPSLGKILDDPAVRAKVHVVAASGITAANGLEAYILKPAGQDARIRLLNGKVFANTLTRTAVASNAEIYLNFDAWVE